MLSIVLACLQFLFCEDMWVHGIYISIQASFSLEVINQPAMNTPCSLVETRLVVG